MIVDFYDIDKPLGGSVQRDIHFLPSVGDKIAWHRGDSTMYYIISITHVFEDRDWYKANPEIGGDRTCVTLKKVR